MFDVLENLIVDNFLYDFPDLDWKKINSKRNVIVLVLVVFVGLLSY